MTPKVLVVDGMNHFHRARSGFTGGEWFVVFNALRNLRALIELHKPTRVYFVMEGTPFKKLSLLKEYKANRAVEPGSDKEANLRDFFRQVDVARNMLEARFPVSVVWHHAFEADDTVYNLIKRSSSAVPWVVASNDSDFTQLLNQFSHVSVYNPMKKTYVQKTAYNYVQWKALRGDPSDNIPKVPGMSDKKAERILTVAGSATDFLENKELVEMWCRNCELIKFQTWTDEEAALMRSSSPTRTWDAVRADFEKMGFQSLLKEPTWGKFVGTFDPLFGD